MKRILACLLALTLLPALAACTRQNDDPQFDFSYTATKAPYEPGETVEIVVTVTNLGPKYRYVGADFDLFGPATLRHASPSVDYTMPAPPFASSTDATENVLKTGESVSRTYYFNSETTSPIGTYDFSLSFAGMTVGCDNAVTLRGLRIEQESNIRAVADGALFATYPVTDLADYRIDITEFSGDRGFSVDYTLTIGGYSTYESYDVILSADLQVETVYGEYGRYSRYLPYVTAEKIRGAEDALAKTLADKGYDKHSGFYLSIDREGRLCLTFEVIADKLFGDHEHLFFSEVICEAVQPKTAGVEGFEFSLTWGCYGISSYSSTTGRLVKTTDATHKEDYITQYKLSEEERERIYALLQQLDVTSYPDNYNPHPDGLMSSPTMTLILTLVDGDVYKRISAKDIAIAYESADSRGQKFLDTCREIEQILTSTAEWKALPEYEFFYE